MTKIDFYLLADKTLESRHIFACRLTEKVYKMGHNTYIHCENKGQSEAIDALLWSYRKSSFVPHHTIAGAAQDNHRNTVQIGYGEAKEPSNCQHNVLINLSNTVPEFFSRFERVTEIVVQEAKMTENSRVNWRFYRDRGYLLKTHNLR